MTEQVSDSAPFAQPAIAYGADPSSEDVLRDVFQVAANTKVPACFLRLGAPRTFRHEVIRVNGDDGKYTPAFETLLSREIPSIEFVLAAPNGNAFLNRMDLERKPLREIWRVRRSILRFCEGLLVAAGIRQRSRLSPLCVAFHNQPLLWNLSCAGSDYVVIRAYFGGATGHDEEVAEFVARGGEKQRLAESMLHYYRSVRDNPATERIERTEQLAHYKEWPSLFKGNAVWFENDQGEPSAVKMVTSAAVHACEATWLQSRHGSARDCRHFRPVGLRSAFYQPDGESDEHVLRMPAVTGISAEELLYQLQRAAALPDAPIEQLRAAGDTVLRQGVAALREFHAQTTIVSPDRQTPAPYPWRQRLRSALDEAAGFVTTDRRLIAACEHVLDHLGASLEKQACRYFRDAHLKNRLIALPDGLDASDPLTFSAWLQSIPVHDLQNWFRTHTFDIDFETAQFQTTGSDDILHLLTSPNTGWTSGELLREGFQFLRRWWTHAEAAESTLLCRSFRELCRRIWYAHVMPITAQQRYSMEPPDHHLCFVERLVEQDVSLRPIAEFVHTYRKQAPQGWRDLNSNAARLPLRLSDTPPQDEVDELDTVFLSCHHQDYEHAEKLSNYLVSQQIKTFFCNQSLPDARDTNFTQQIHQAIERTRHFVVVASRPEHASAKWPAWERDQFVALKNAPHSRRGNLLTVTVGEVPAERLPTPLKSLQVFTLQAALAGQILPYLPMI